MTTEEPEVAVIGAGPYGLSIAAHLKDRGVGVRVFGPPMSFWKAMPATLNLKSFAFATNIDVPRPHFSFPEYCRAHGLPDLEPNTMESFAEYGLWVQRTLIPEVDPLLVTGVKSIGEDFEVTRSDGQALRVRRVVVAIGLTGFAHLPESIANLPPERVSHSSAHHDVSAFRGQSVAVVGAGASAVEVATLLHEAGAKPLLIVRGDEVVFHTRFDPDRSLRERLRQPNSVLGPGRKSWALEHFPMALHFVPEARRVRFTRGYLGPAGPWWIVDRFRGNVPVILRSEVVRAQLEGDKVRLDIRGKGSQHTHVVDHIVAGTGFQVDVDRMPFLDSTLRTRVRRVERSPALSRHFESSVPGLYFVGAAAAFSFGPLFRFVAGARVAAPAVAKHIASRGRRGGSRTASAPSVSRATLAQP
jgi:cation diffusion facilitator CzcD-associated flavoprotein CzcO